MTTLDEIEEIKELVNNDKHFKYKNIVSFNCESIEKSLKALEIIKEKKVDIRALEYTRNYKEYNARILNLHPTITTSVYFLTKEEFNLLKEVLE